MRFGGRAACGDIVGTRRDEGRRGKRSGNGVNSLEDPRMTPQELEQLRQLLEENRATFLETLRTSVESAKGDELDQTRVGRLSRMDAIQSQCIIQAANRRISEELQQIEFALQRMVRGTYGWCQSCGRDVSFARLQAIPHTLKCIDCANKKG